MMSKRTSTSVLITNEILDKGLAASTWREKYPDAYSDLVEHYREDIERGVNDVLLKQLARIVSKYRDI